MSKKRLFVAIGLPDTLVTELDRLQNKLKPFARDAKWVKPAGIHLTLKFLGYVEEEKLQSILEALEVVAGKYPEAFIRAQGCGFFPNARRPNILWMGIEANLQPLQQTIEEEMAKLGFEKENRAYSPHLTLARFKDQRGLIPLTQETQKFANNIFGEFTAKGFTLYESVLRPQGAEYHTLETFALNSLEGGRPYPPNGS